MKNMPDSVKKIIQDLTGRQGKLSSELKNGASETLWGLQYIAVKNSHKVFNLCFEYGKKIWI